MRLKEQTYVLTIEKYRNITKAAEALGISQPALTSFLNTLEARLGARLFDRKEKPLTLTPVGELYVKKAIEMVKLKEEFDEELLLLLKQDLPCVRIGLQALRAPHIVPLIKLAVKQHFPQMEVIFHESHSPILYEMLKAGELDLILCNRCDTLPDTEEITLLKDRLLLGVPSDHPLISQRRLRSDTYPWIDLSLFKEEYFNILPPYYTIRQYTDQIFETVGWTPKIADSFTRVEATIQMVAAGSGLCFVLESYLSLFHIPDSISFFTIGNPPAVYDYVAAYPRKYRRSPVFDKLLEIIQFILSK